MIIFTGYYCIDQIQCEILSSWVDPFFAVNITLSSCSYSGCCGNPELSLSVSKSNRRVCVTGSDLQTAWNCDQTILLPSISRISWANQNIWQADITMITLHFPPEEFSSATRSRSSRCLFLFPFPSSERPRGVEN